MLFGANVVDLTLTVTGNNGFELYLFDPDIPKVQNCSRQCSLVIEILRRR